MSSSPRASLETRYPPSHAATSADAPEQRQEDSQAPTLYIIDVGLSHSPAEAFESGRILLGSTDGRPLQTLIEHQRAPNGIDIDPATEQLFWTNMGIPSKNDGSINSSNLQCQQQRIIIGNGNVHTPKQICVDRTHRKLYFCDREGLRVMRCNFDGSQHETIVQTGDWRDPEHIKDQTRWCVSIAVAPPAGKFYWTQKGPSKGFQGRIFCANIAVPAGQLAYHRTDVDCLFSNLPEPIDLDVDEETSSLYWTERGELPYGDSLNKASLLEPLEISPVREAGQEGTLGRMGVGYEILVRNFHETIGLKVDAPNRHIYIADLGGSVYRCDMDGRNTRKSYDGEGAFAGLALHAP